MTRVSSSRSTLCVLRGVSANLMNLASSQQNCGDAGAWGQLGGMMSGLSVRSASRVALSKFRVAPTTDAGVSPSH
jgi:hypothetical protein